MKVTQEDFKKSKERGRGQGGGQGGTEEKGRGGQARAHPRQRREGRQAEGGPGGEGGDQGGGEGLDLPPTPAVQIPNDNIISSEISIHHFRDSTPPNTTTTTSRKEGAAPNHRTTLPTVGPCPQ